MVAAAEDLAVVIPVRGRYDGLTKVLRGLEEQTVQGFDTLVVVDGTDVPPPSVAEGNGRSVLQVRKRGPGAARDAGVAATARPLVLFLGADMLPTPGLVEAHLEAFDGAPTTGVLGHVDWHPEVAGRWENGWLQRTGFQFDFETIPPGGDAGWQRFYSCNVLLTRELLHAAGGFGKDFPYYFEDVDTAVRLDQSGLRLRYAPDARALHLHAYDQTALVRRFHGMGRGEEQLVQKHPDARRLVSDRAGSVRMDRRRSRAWVGIDRHASHAPLPPGLADRIRRRADHAQWQRIGPWFEDGVAGERDLIDLREYLGDAYDPHILADHRAAVDGEEQEASSEQDFYRTSTTYLYDLTAFAREGVKVPYRAVLSRLVPAPARLLDYGAGIGTDGLRFLDQGYSVDFADFDNPSTTYLRWRLARRGHGSHVFDVEQPLPTGYDATYCFDVIEHVPEPLQLLERMEETAKIVVVNLLEPDPDDTHLHHELPIAEILARARTRGLLHHSLHYGRSHLIAYRSRRSSRWGEVVSDQLRGAGLAMATRPILGSLSRRLTPTR